MKMYSNVQEKWFILPFLTEQRKKKRLFLLIPKTSNKTPPPSGAPSPTCLVPSLHAPETRASDITTAVTFFTWPLNLGNLPPIV